MTSDRAPRNTLSRDRVVAGAIALADAEGLDALTIRTLAERLGVRPMALYHHIANKDELLDAIVDVVHGEVHLPTGDNWRDELAERSRSMRAVLGRHRWALGLMETRASPGPATIASHEAVLGVLFAAGFSTPATAHAYAVLDAFVYGFALQESMLDAVGLGTATDELLEQMDFSASPHMAAFAADHAAAPDYDFGDSFEVGLTIVLDGIAGLRRGDDR